MSSKTTTEVMMAEHFKKFYQFFQEKTFCDITLVSNEGLKIAAHKIVLASASRVFYTMFTGPLKANDQNEISMKEIDFEVLDMIVKFAYTTKLEIKEHTVKKLLIAANLYELSYVKELCSEYINETINLTNCVSLIKTNIDKDTPTHLSNETINLDTTKPSLTFGRNTSIGSNIIFAITGHSNSGDCCVKYMDIRNEDDLKWKSSDCLFFSPPRKETTMVVSENGIILSIGGREQSGSVNLVDELDLNSMSKQWIPTTPLLRHRRGFAVCTYKQYIYVVGGYDYSDKNYLDSVEYYDTNSKEWMKIYEPMPTARDSCSAAIYNNQLYVFGGYNGDILATVESYDFEKKHWKKLDPMPICNYDMSITRIENIIYLIGGNNGLQRVYKYDLHNFKWNKMPNLRVKIHNAKSSVIQQNDLFLFVNNDGELHCDRYDADKKQWQLVDRSREQSKDYGHILCFNDVTLNSYGINYYY